jgi:hypothetical protein
MAQRVAVGNGPVAYFTDDGQRVLLPLSEIYFDGNDVKTRTTAPAPASLANWLKYLVAQGRLVPGAAPIPGSAMVLTAAAAGATGNSIVVRVKPNSADDTKIDITVTETNKYTNLTVASLPTVLGIAGATAAGSNPGLVRFQEPAAGAGTPPDPAEGPASIVSPAGALPAWKIVGPLPASTTTSFILEARGAGSEKGTMTISVANVVGPTGAKTFTLNVVWTKTITIAVVADLTTAVTDLAYAVRVSEPTGGGGYQLPREGTITLRGGAPPVQAAQATATLLAANP